MVLHGKERDDVGVIEGGDRARLLLKAGKPPGITGDVLVQDDRIVAVGEDVGTTGRPDVVLDAENKLVLPGFVNGAPCCIMVGESTWLRLRGVFRGCLLGDIVLKGKKQMVKVYQIVADNADTDGALAAAVDYNKRIGSVPDLDPERVGRVG